MQNIHMLPHQSVVVGNILAHAPSALIFLSDLRDLNIFTNCTV